MILCPVRQVAWAWPRALLLTAGAGAVLVAAVALTWVVLWAHKRSRRRKLRLVLQNTGNVRCSYEVCVDELPDAVVYLEIGGKRPVRGNVGADHGEERGATGGAKWRWFISSAGGLLSGLGVLFSGKVGQQIRWAARGVRGARVKEQSVADLCGRLGSAFGREESVAAGRDNNLVGGARSERWWQTLPLEPGEQLFLELQVMPRDLCRGRHYRLVVRSRPVGRRDDQPVVAERTLNIGRVRWVWCVVPMTVVWGGAGVAVFVLWRLLDGRG